MDQECLLWKIQNICPTVNNIFTYSNCVLSCCCWFCARLSVAKSDFFLPPCVHLDSFNLLLPHSGIRIFLSSHSNQGRRVLSYFRGKENDFRQAFLFSHGNIFRRSSGSGRTYYLRERRRVGEAGFKEKFTTLSERKWRLNKFRGKVFIKIPDRKEMP